MFTWICPKCGREVPPAYNDCPNCNPPSPAKESLTATAFQPQPVQPPPPKPVPEPLAPTQQIPIASPQPAAPPPPPPPVYTQQPPVYSQQPVYAPPPVAPAPPPPPVAASPVPTFGAPAEPAPASSGIPAWLASILVAGGLIGVLAVLYVYVLPSNRTTAATPANSTSAQKGAGPATGAGGTHPLAKHLEITAVRISEDAKQNAKIQFVIVNHSAADLPDLDANIAIKTTAGNTIFEFPMKVPSLGPYESKDLSETVKTQMRGYELPDWQFVKPELTITSQP